MWTQDSYDDIILIFVAHLLLHILLGFDLIYIPILPVTLAQFDGSGPNIFPVQFLDCSSEVSRVLEADKTVTFRLVASLVSNYSRLLKAGVSGKCPGQHLQQKI